MRASTMMRRLRRAATMFVATVILVSLMAGAAWWWASSKFDEIPTFDQATPSTQPGEPEVPRTTLTLPEPEAHGVSTYLVFGVGSQGVDGDESARTGIGADRLGQSDGLTDSIALVVADSTTKNVTVVSLPRDTWLEGRRSRINEVYVKDGPQAFADTVTMLTGLPVHHMVAVNFAGVVDVVDALGGVEVSSTAAMSDTNSGLSLPAGCTRLNGAQALAVMRSRHLQYLDAAVWRSDPTGDFGRIERTQQVLAAALAGTGWVSIPQRLPALLDAAADNVTRDTELGLSDVVALARSFSGGANVRFWQPPADPTMRGKASVVVWHDDAAVELARLATAVGAGHVDGHELDPEPPPAAPAPQPEPPAVALPERVSPAPQLLAGCP